LRVIMLAMSGGLSAVALANEPQAPVTAIFSNEEQVYFAKEAKQPAPPLVYLKVAQPADHRALPVVTGVDAFGAPALVDPVLLTQMTQGMKGKNNFRSATLGIGIDKPIQLRRARPATCWVAIKKDKPKADGSPDWYFAQGVKLHDQGGRAMAGTGVADTQPVMIRMRNVIWPNNADGKPSSNKPSIVLYVHKPDQFDRSEAYVWGDPGAARIGINLRWMQASCGIDGMEQPSAVTATNFRG
jgi:hypothetical protein